MSELVMTSVPGFKVAGVHAGLKKNNGLDFALIVSDRDCTAAGAFTKNLVKAAPVQYDKAVLAKNPTGIRAVAINSKNANAVTGEQGMRDAAEMAALVQEANGLGADSTLVMSTGVIGVVIEPSSSWFLLPIFLEVFPCHVFAIVLHEVSWFEILASGHKGFFLSVSMDVVSS